MNGLIHIGDNKTPAGRFNEKPSTGLSEQLKKYNLRSIKVIKREQKHIDWENDVYYYEPQFDTIMDRIEETCHDLGYGSEVRIYMDAEAFLPEQEVIEWLEQKED